MNNLLFRSNGLRRFFVSLAALAAVVVLLVLFFPWDALRGPIGRYVSEQLGRRFEITQHLAVHLEPYPWGRTTVRAEGLEIANPGWAVESYLVKAGVAEFEIKLWPLLLGKVDLPRVSLTDPQIGLQIEPDGRRTWAFSRDTSDARASPNIGSLVIDHGTVKYRASAQGADMLAQFSITAESSTSSTASVSSAPLPLSYKVTGKWKNEAFTASGRTGGVLQLSKNLKESFPIEVNAALGKTTLKAKGSIENLQELTGLDTTFDLQGRNLEELYTLLGVVLPSTPPYKLRGKVHK